MGIVIFIIWLALTYFIVKHIFRKNDKKYTIEKQDVKFWVRLYHIDEKSVVDHKNRVKLDLSKYNIISYKDRFLEIPEYTKVFVSYEKEDKHLNYNDCFIFMSFSLTKSEEANLIAAINTNTISYLMYMMQITINKSKEIKIYIM